jgi:hypothetical protein
MLLWADKSFSHQLMSVLFPICILIFSTITGPNFEVIHIGWYSSKTVYGDLALHSKWLSWPRIGWKIGNLWKSSSEQLNGMKPKLFQIQNVVLEWSCSKSVSVDPINYPKWAWQIMGITDYGHHIMGITDYAALACPALSL